MTDYHLSQEQIHWTTLLLASYRRYLGHDLIPPGDSQVQAQTLFHAPFALLSHRTHLADPVFNYANQTAFTLWEMDWPSFTQMPSRLSAEPMHREERAQLLAQLNSQNYVDNYQGVRISSQGRRFHVEQVTLWNITNEQEERLGQAAMFKKWAFLD